MSNLFDPKSPLLDCLPLTDNQRRLMMAYMRLQFCVCEDTPDAHWAMFTVGHQTFFLGEVCDTQEEASWMCWQFVKALEEVIHQEEKP